MILILSALHFECRAQSVIVGDKLPELNLRRWLMDLQPDDAAYTCLMFHHSESELCREALDRAVALIGEYDSQFNIIILTKEYYDKAGVALTEYLDDHVGVVFDQGARAHRTLKVNFVPFCVICDKRRRVLWSGNSAMLTQEIMDKIITTQR